MNAARRQFGNGDKTPLEIPQPLQDRPSHIDFIGPNKQHDNIAPESISDLVRAQAAQVSSTPLDALDVSSAYQEFQIDPYSFDVETKYVARSLYRWRRKGSFLSYLQEKSLVDSFQGAMRAKGLDSAVNAHVEALDTMVIERMSILLQKLAGCEKSWAKLQLESSFEAIQQFIDDFETLNNFLSSDDKNALGNDGDSIPTDLNAKKVYELAKRYAVLMAERNRLSQAEAEVFILHEDCMRVKQKLAQWEQEGAVFIFLHEKDMIEEVFRKINANPFTHAMTEGFSNEAFQKSFPKATDLNTTLLAIRKLEATLLQKVSTGKALMKECHDTFQASVQGEKAQDTMPVGIRLQAMLDFMDSFRKLVKTLAPSDFHFFTTQADDSEKVDESSQAAKAYKNFAHYYAELLDIQEDNQTHKEAK